MNFLLDYYYETDGFSYSSSTSGGGGVIAIFSLLFALALLISIILIFKKAGYSWWKALIPIYNIFCFHQLIGLSGKFTLAYFFLPIIAGVLTAVSPVIGAIASVLVGLTLFIMHCVECNRLAQSFNKGTGWAILIFFFTPIMFMIIGFSKSITYGNRPTSMPRLVPVNNGTTPQMNFDPNTGQPINNVQPAMNFDPNTGQPINNIQPTDTVEPTTTFTPNVEPTNNDQTNNQTQVKSDLPDSIDSIIIKQ